MKRNSLALIDERPLTRASVSHLLETSTQQLIVLPFSTPAELLSDLPALCSNLELTVLSIGGADPVEERVSEHIHQLKRALPDVPVVVLSDREEVCSMVEVFRHGVRGYIPTTYSPAVVIAALRLVQAGGTFMPTKAVLKTLGQQSSAVEERLHSFEPTSVGAFTPRQFDVLQLLREGKSNKVIAFELEMQESTVKVHVRHIMQKLKATNRTQAVILAYQLFEVNQARPSPAVTH